MTTPPPTEATFRERLIRGDQLKGLLLRVPATTTIDMAGGHGYDFVLLDTEHGIADQRDVLEHITAARAAGLVTLVRLGEGEPALALRALDGGAEGVVIPHVRTAAEAEAAVRLAHYPPRGDRGFATYTAAGGWGETPPREHAAASARRTVVVCMIEDPTGVDNAAAIAATDAVDVVWVGNADLAACLDYESGAVDSARREVWSEARRQATPVMALVSTTEEARHAVADGAQLVLLNTQALLNRTLREWATDW